MLKALLLDLDNTLLLNDMADFLPRYLPMLSQHAAELLPPDHPCNVQKTIIQSVQATIQNTDPAETNTEVFWRNMQERSGLDWLGMGALAHFEAFYEDEYHKLEAVTSPDPAARPLIEWACERGLQVVIATNPLYPRVAIEGRIRWAKLDDCEIDFVTWADNMTATKPHVAYYEQILAEIGRAPAECLMVGDDWRNDIEPTAELGIHNYWLPGKEGSDPADASLVSGVGSLGELHQRLQEGWLQS